MSSGTMVASVLGSMAALASMAVTLALCYLFWRKRGQAKDAKDELEPLQVQGGGTQQSNTPVSSNTPSKAQGRQQSPGKSAAVGAKGTTTMELSRHNVENRLYQGTAAPSPSTCSVASAVAGGKSSSKDKMAASLKDAAAASSASESMMQALIAGAAEYEMADDDDDILEPAGQIQFSLEYDFYASTLVLRIIQGKDLPAKDVIGTSDPYVKVTLLPDKKRKLETKVKHRTLNPRWNETFYFQGFPLHKLQKSTLHLNVYDWDRFSRDDQIGEVFLPLGAVDLTQKPTFWKSLKPAENCKLGDLLVSLMYVPRTSELTIGFMKARRLKAKDITGASDPYVKVWLMRGDKRLEKRKTEVHKATLNPVFEECFTFVVPWEHIRETSMTVTVMDWDNVGRNEPIGNILLSSKSGPLEARHWTQMLNKPRSPVFQWHKLKPV